LAPFKRLGGAGARRLKRVMLHFPHSLALGALLGENLTLSESVSLEDLRWIRRSSAVAETGDFATVAIR
jgi:hypothetical protein